MSMSAIKYDESYLTFGSRKFLWRKLLASMSGTAAFNVLLQEVF